jgi:DNA polymerase alpha subunit A
MTKRPEDYPDANTQPHVQVALALRKEGIPVMVGEMIPYIVCLKGEAESNAPIADRARHPTHVKKNNLKIDYDWYLTHQIHPSAARLCEHIPGLDSMVIAECLGLDANSFRKSQHSTSSSSDMFMPSASQQSLETRFAECERWKLNCPRCTRPITLEALFSSRLPSNASTATSTEMKVDSVVSAEDLATTDSFFQGCFCSHADCKTQLDDAFLENHLILFLRKHQGASYAAEYECDACGKRTREPVIHHRFERRLCPACLNDVRMSNNPKSLHNQLLYLKHMFDLDYWVRVLDPSPVQRRAIGNHSLAPLMKDLKALVDDALAQNKFASIPCSSLFSCFEGLKVQ